MATRAAIANLGLAMISPRAALATIISDGGFACIFNANGVAATPAQRGLTATVPALSTLGPYDVRREGAGTTPRCRRSRRAAPRLSAHRSRATPSHFASRRR